MGWEVVSCREHTSIATQQAKIYDTLLLGLSKYLLLYFSHSRFCFMPVGHKHILGLNVSYNLTGEFSNIYFFAYHTYPDIGIVVSCFAIGAL